jgi:hypothetical protein
VELWLENAASDSGPLECQHWEDRTLLSRPEMLSHVHNTALARLKKQVRAPAGRMLVTCSRMCPFMPCIM